MYVCMFMHVYVCVYVYVYVCTHVCMHNISGELSGGGKCPTQNGRVNYVGGGESVIYPHLLNHKSPKQFLLQFSIRAPLSNGVNFIALSPIPQNHIMH